MKTIIYFFEAALFLALVFSCGSNETQETINQEVHVNEDRSTLDAASDKEASQVPNSMEEPGYQVGDWVEEDFSLKNVDGKMISMADYPDAKGYIIVFTCNHCPYSIAYEDRLIALDQKYKAQGYPVIAINPNDPTIVEEDSYEAMIIRAEKKGFTFPYLFDDGQKVYPRFGATKTPHVYVVNKTDEGSRIAYVGAIDDSKEIEDVEKVYLADAMEAIVKGKAPAMAQTKAFGCSIKDKDDPYKSFK